MHGFQGGNVNIRVLHFYKTAWPTSIGGVEVSIDTLCQATAKLGVDNTVLSLADEPFAAKIDLAGYKVVQVKQDCFLASTGFSIAALAKFRKLAASADIIHYHFLIHLQIWCILFVG
ncbi:MAG: glycosyltransferase [Gammaproteobacteria bacterium]|nr:glycosyltransferase [Gammaproteobacteria bacterium]